MRSRPSIIAICAFMVLVACSPALGQDQNPSTALFNLRFQGGTVEDYVNTISKTVGGANVFVAPEAASVPMPAVELQNVTVAGALGVLHGRVHQDSLRMVQLSYSEGGTFAENERAIFTIGAKVSGASQRASTNQNRVWSVATLQTYQVSVEDMLTAIQAGLDMIGNDGGGPEAKLRFHEATGLLIARGSPEQLHTIDEVIERLHASGSAKQAARHAAEEPDAELRDLQKQLDEQTKLIQTLKDRIAQLESQFSKSKPN